jgi:hypothetical protein
MGIHCFELAAADRYGGLQEHVEAATQHHELAADIPYCFAIVPSEIGDGLEVWGKLTSQPHEFDVALALALKTPAGLNVIQVAIQIQLQQDRGMI